MEPGTEAYNNYISNLLIDIDHQNSVELSQIADKLFVEECRAVNEWGMGCSRTIHTLFYFWRTTKDKENIWKIWQYKCCNMDTYCSIDMEWIYSYFSSLQDITEYVGASSHPQKRELLDRINNDVKTWLTQEKMVKVFSPNYQNYKICPQYILYG